MPFNVIKVWTALQFYITIFNAAPSDSSMMGNSTVISVVQSLLVSPSLWSFPAVCQHAFDLGWRQMDTWRCRSELFYRHVWSAEGEPAKNYKGSPGGVELLYPKGT